MAKPILLLLVVATSAACADFANPTTVVDLRVLGIQMEPSEIILDIDDPSTNVPVQMTPLIVDPRKGEVSYTVVACPNDPFAAAPPGPGGNGAFPSGGARTTVGSAPCDEDDENTWTLTAAPIPVDLGAPPAPFTVTLTDDQLKAAFMADLFPDQFGNPHGGFDLGEPLRVQLNIQAGGESLIAIKRILYWGQRLTDAQRPNQLPLIDTVEIFPERDPDSAEPIGMVEILAAGAPHPIAATATPWIRPSRADAEPYVTTILDPDTHKAVPLTVERETLRYAFYATAGTFEPARTSSELVPGFVGTPHLEAQYKPPKDVTTIPLDADGKRTVTIWIVVRDDRGGESWQIRTLELVP